MCSEFVMENGRCTDEHRMYGILCCIPFAQTYNVSRDGMSLIKGNEFAANENISPYIH